MEKIGFCLIDGYALMSAAAALEPLRAANLFAPEPLYEMVCLSVDGEKAQSSLPALFPTTGIERAGLDFDVVFVVAGGDPFALRSPKLAAWLAALDKRGVPLGGISGGAGVLVKAGLLDGRRFTLHWHHFDTLKDKHPTALAERRLFVLDRDRYTCAGGTAPLDMMNALIAAKHGFAFAQKISDWFIQTEVRSAGAPQRTSIEARYGALPKSVSGAIELMESHIADSLSVEQIANLLGVSPRQLQRNFNTTLGLTPAAFYREIKLSKAHELVCNSSLNGAEIAEITGFASAAAFSSAYARLFGETVTQTRAALAQGRSISEIPDPTAPWD